MLRPIPVLLAGLLVASVALGCDREAESGSGGDTAPAPDASATDAGEDGEDGASDLVDDTSLADTSVTTATDTATTTPGDIDEGPRELVNGTPVRFGHVVDGDTLDVFVGQVSVKVYTGRLKGLSAPECEKDSVRTEKFGFRNECVADQEFYGLRSMHGLRELVSADGVEGWVTCDDVAVGEWCPTDAFGRYLIYVEVDGVDVATEMARRGHGFSYTAFTSSKRAQICAAEYDAQDARRGIWENGTVDAVISMMNPSTQSWYEDHDARCDAALGQ